MARKQSCISAYLTSHDLEGDGIATLNYKVGIESQEMTVIWVCEGDYDDWHAHNRLGRLFNSKELQTKLNNSVTFDFKLKIVFRLELHMKSDSPSLSMLIFDQLESLLYNEAFGNFTLVASDGRKFLVDKSLLAVRSTVLERMMNTNMCENQMNEATILDMTGPVLEEFLRFLYCGKLDHIDEFVAELLAAADKYDVSDLKPFCEALLAQEITPENAVETLILADYHNSADLKDFCIGFIVW